MDELKSEEARIVHLLNYYTESGSDNETLCELQAKLVRNYSNQAEWLAKNVSAPVLSQALVLRWAGKGK